MHRKTFLSKLVVIILLGVLKNRQLPTNCNAQDNNFPLNISIIRYNLTENNSLKHNRDVISTAWHEEQILQSVLAYIGLADRYIWE